MAFEDAAIPIARFAATLEFDQIPPEVVRTVKRIILDTLGTTLAANTLGVGCPELLQVARRGGGVEEATLIGIGAKVPALMAALANGGMSHALNYDDVSGPRGSGHLGVTSLPAALAAAEFRQRVSGRDLIAAVVVGNEVMARLGRSLMNAETEFTESKPQPTQMPGCFSAALSAGRVLGLSEDVMRSVLGHALMQASGGRQPVLEGRPAKAIYAAYSNHVGMLSAQLADAGLECDCAAFEGQAGFFRTYYGGRYDRAALVDDLGSRWEMLDVGFKPWPTTNVAHPFIFAAQTLRDEHKLASSDIASVRIQGGSHARTFCEPEATRKSPSSPVQAEDSIYFAVAKTLANGTITLADLQPTSDGLRQTEALRLTSCMTLSVDESLHRSGIVELTTVRGQTFSQRIDAPPGHPSNPLPQEVLEAKFRDCARHASTAIPEGNLARAIDRVANLEQVEDVSELCQLLSNA